MASGTGSDSAKAGKSVADTLMPQAVVMRTTAEQTVSFAQTPTETKASLAFPDRVNMSTSHFWKLVCAFPINPRFGAHTKFGAKVNDRLTLAA